MPIYKAQPCECGHTNEQFLPHTDKHSVLLKCKGCKRTVTALQIRDDKQSLKTNNEVTGVFHHDN